MRPLWSFARTVELPMWFYNVGPGRDRAQVEAEIRVVLATGCAVLGLCEAIGYRLPDVKGYTLVRDTSTPSRANIAAYVRDDLPISRVRWLDLTTTWPRTQHGGEHPPRSFLVFRAAGVQVIVAHQAPKNAATVWLAQWEGVNALVKVMDRRRSTDDEARRRPRVVLWDANRQPNDTGPGPLYLAENTGGAVVGTRIDNAVIRRGKASHVAYPERVGGVQLRSDHHHAFRFTFTVRYEWTQQRSLP